MTETRPGGYDQRVREIARETIEAYRDGIKDAIRAEIRETLADFRESLDQFCESFESASSSKCTSHGLMESIGQDDVPASLRGKGNIHFQPVPDDGLRSATLTLAQWETILDLLHSRWTGSDIVRSLCGQLRQEPPRIPGVSSFGARGRVVP